MTDKECRRVAEALEALLDIPPGSSVCIIRTVSIRREHDGYTIEAADSEVFCSTLLAALGAAKEAVDGP